MLGPVVDIVWLPGLQLHPCKTYKHVMLVAEPITGQTSQHITQLNKAINDMCSYLINAYLYVVHSGLSVASRGGATYFGLVRPLDITVCGKDRQ